MKDDFINRVQFDFDRARTQETITKIFSLIRNETDDLFSFNDLKSLIRPKSTTYKGIIPIKVSHIVGSEGRYNDFNRHFLPKSDFLRSRWQSINMAHYTSKELPPIKVYEIGGVYFVRDGNHRVSVANTRKNEFIDAEVITLNAEIKLTPTMTREQIIMAVIEYEKKLFLKHTKLDLLRPGFYMDFTSIGRYDEIINHVNGHKYYLNLDKKYEIPFQQALLSWYDNVYTPIIAIILEEKILTKFPDRTAADLYVWICKHWDELKRGYGQNYPLKKAVMDYSAKYGKNIFAKMIDSLRKFSKRFRG